MLIGLRRPITTKISWVGGVRPYQIIPRRRLVGLPYCKACGAQMWLTSIEPEKADHDRRTFECPRCQEETVEIVKYK